jgi:hypothetical protein
MRSIFSGSLYGDFWNWGDIGNGYGSGVSGLNLDHNRYTLVPFALVKPSDRPRQSAGHQCGCAGCGLEGRGHDRSARFR